MNIDKYGIKISNEDNKEISYEGDSYSLSEALDVKNGSGSTADLILNGGSVELGSGFPSAFPCKLSWSGLGDFNISIPGFNFSPSKIDWTLFDKIQELRIIISDINDLLINIILDLECCVDPDLYNENILKIFKWLVEDEDGFCAILTEAVKIITQLTTIFKTLICFIRPVAGNPWLGKGARDPLEYIYEPFLALEKLSDELMTGDFLNLIIKPAEEIRDYLQNCYSKSSNYKDNWRSANDGFSDETLMGLQSNQNSEDEWDSSSDEKESTKDKNFPKKRVVDFNDYAVKDEDLEKIPLPADDLIPFTSVSNTEEYKEYNNLPEDELYTRYKKSKEKEISPYMKESEYQLNEDGSIADTKYNKYIQDQNKAVQEYNNAIDEDHKKIEQNWNSLSYEDKVKSAIMADKNIVTNDSNKTPTKDQEADLIFYKFDVEKKYLANEKKKNDAYFKYLEDKKASEEEYVAAVSEYNNNLLNTNDQYGFKKPVLILPELSDYFEAERPLETIPPDTDPSYDRIIEKNKEITKSNKEMHERAIQKYQKDRAQAIIEYNNIYEKYKNQNAVRNVQKTLQKKQLEKTKGTNQEALKLRAAAVERAKDKQMCFCIGDLLSALHLPLYQPEFVDISTYEEFDEKVKGRYLYKEVFRLDDVDEQGNYKLDPLSLDNVDSRGGWYTNNGAFSFNTSSWFSDYEPLDLGEAINPTQIMELNQTRQNAIKNYRKKGNKFFAKINAKEGFYYKKWINEKDVLEKRISELEKKKILEQKKLLEQDTYSSYIKYLDSKHSISANKELNDLKMKKELYYSEFNLNKYIESNDEKDIQDYRAGLEYYNDGIKVEEEAIQDHNFTIILIDENPLPCTCNILCDLLQMLLNIIIAKIKMIINKIIEWIMDAILNKYIKYIIKFILAKLQCLIDLFFLKDKLDKIGARAKRDIENAKGMLSEYVQDPRCDLESNPGFSALDIGNSDTANWDLYNDGYTSYDDGLNDGYVTGAPDWIDDGYIYDDEGNPLYDENGDPINNNNNDDINSDINTDPIYDDSGNDYLYDDEGNPLYDDNGDPIDYGSNSLNENLYDNSDSDSNIDIRNTGKIKIQNIKKEGTY